MSEKRQTKRDFIKKAVYAAPAILTLPSFSPSPQRVPVVVIAHQAPVASVPQAPAGGPVNGGSSGAGFSKVL